MRLAVLIPAYNERQRLAEAVARIDACPPPAPPGGAPLERLLIVVDDGSTDGTTEIVAELGARADVRAVFHQQNKGKGAAVGAAIAEALEAGADFAIIHDADLEYDPADHGRALAPILAGDADAVIGSRFIGQSHRVLYYWHAAANRVITFLSNVCTNLNLTDIECCTKAFSREVLERLTIAESRFGVEPELVARLSRMRLPTGEGMPRPVRIFEVGVSYAGRTYAEGKKITWRDGVSALRVIVKYNLIA